MKKQIDKCPHCGKDFGIYTKTTYHNVPYNFGFDGKPQDNSMMYDMTESFSGGKLAYCQSCDKVICRVSTLDSLWPEDA